MTSSATLEEFIWDSDDLLSACLNAMLDQSLFSSAEKVSCSDSEYLLTTQEALRRVGVPSRCLSRVMNRKGAKYRLHLLEVNGEFLMAPGVMTNWNEWARYQLSGLNRSYGGPDMSQMEGLSEDQLGLSADIEEDHEGISQMQPPRTLAMLETMCQRSVAIFEQEALRLQTTAAPPRIALPRL